MILSYALAWAHIPHDQVRDLIVPPDLSTDEPWMLVADPSATEMLYESEDGGVSWTYVEPDPSGDHLIGGGRLEEGIWVLASLTSYWYSEDQGDTWVEESFPPGGSRAVVGLESVYYLGSSAIYSVKPGGTPVNEQSGTFSLLFADDGGISAVDAASDGWVYENDAWVELGKPLGNPVTAVSGNGKWVGTSDGEVWARTDDDWILCGALPVLGPKGASQEVTNLWVEEPYLVATTAPGGPIVSVDGCESWSDLSVPDLPAYGVAGGTNSAPEAYTVGRLDGAHWIVGGWAGLFETFDAGITWENLEPLGPDYADLPWLPAPEEEPAAGIETGPARPQDLGGCAALALPPLLLPLGLLRRRR